MGLPLEVPLVLVGGVLLFLASTVVFDVVHWLLHQLAASPLAALRAIGGLHQVHHRFLDRSLRIRPEHQRANLLCHVIPEFLTQLAVSLVLLQLLPAPVVGVAIALQVLVFAVILRGRGIDVNHRDIEVLRAYEPRYFCMPRYHALHHVHPDAHFSSWIKLFDHALGTGMSLLGRSVAMAQADTDFGRALAAELERSGAGRVAAAATPDDPALREADILILADGAPAEGAERIAWVERFAALAAGRRLPPEVWVAAPRGGGAFERHARRYYDDPRLIYRHLVLPGVAGSPARSAALAQRALALVRRGFNYVPCSGAAALAFPRFRWLTPAPAAALP
jgi:hypothetical protein